MAFFVERWKQYFHGGLAVRRKKRERKIVDYIYIKKDNIKKNVLESRLEGLFPLLLLDH